MQPRDVYTYLFFFLFVSRLFAMFLAYSWLASLVGGDSLLRCVFLDWSGLLRRFLHPSLFLEFGVVGLWLVWGWVARGWLLFVIDVADSC